MSQQFIGYQRLEAVCKSTTNGVFGAVIDCWLVPSKTVAASGFTTYLHDDDNVYDC